MPNDKVNINLNVTNSIKAAQQQRAAQNNKSSNENSKDINTIIPQITIQSSKFVEQLSKSKLFQNIGISLDKVSQNIQNLSDSSVVSIAELKKSLSNIELLLKNSQDNTSNYKNLPQIFANNSFFKDLYDNLNNINLLLKTQYLNKTQNSTTTTTTESTTSSQNSLSKTDLDPFFENINTNLQNFSSKFDLLIQTVNGLNLENIISKDDLSNILSDYKVSISDESIQQINNSILEQINENSNNFSDIIQKLNNVTQSINSQVDIFNENKQILNNINDNILSLNTQSQQQENNKNIVQAINLNINQTKKQAESQVKNLLANTNISLTLNSNIKSDLDNLVQQKQNNTNKEQNQEQSPQIGEQTQSQKSQQSAFNVNDNSIQDLKKILNNITVNTTSKINIVNKQNTEESEQLSEQDEQNSETLLSDDVSELSLSGIQSNITTPADLPSPIQMQKQQSMLSHLPSPIQMQKQQSMLSQGLPVIPTEFSQNNSDNISMIKQSGLLPDQIQMQKHQDMMQASLHRSEEQNMRQEEMLTPLSQNKNQINNNSELSIVSSQSQINNKSSIGIKVSDNKQNLSSQKKPVQIKKKAYPKEQKQSILFDINDQINSTYQQLQNDEIILYDDNQNFVQCKLLTDQSEKNVLQELLNSNDIQSIKNAIIMIQTQINNLNTLLTDQSYNNYKERISIYLKTLQQLLNIAQNKLKLVTQNNNTDLAKQQLNNTKNTNKQVESVIKAKNSNVVTSPSDFVNSEMIASTANDAGNKNVSVSNINTKNNNVSLPQKNNTQSAKEKSAQISQQGQQGQQNIQKKKTPIEIITQISDKINLGNQQVSTFGKQYVQSTLINAEQKSNNETNSSLSEEELNKLAFKSLQQFIGNLRKNKILVYDMKQDKKVLYDKNDLIKINQAVKNNTIIINKSKQKETIEKKQSLSKISTVTNNTQNTSNLTQNDKQNLNTDDYDEQEEDEYIDEDEDINKDTIDKQINKKQINKHNDNKKVSSNSNFSKLDQSTNKNIKQNNNFKNFQQILDILKNNKLASQPIKVLTELANTNTNTSLLKQDVNNKQIKKDQKNNQINSLFNQLNQLNKYKNSINSFSQQVSEKSQPISSSLTSGLFKSIQPSSFLNGTIDLIKIASEASVKKQQIPATILSQSTSTISKSISNVSNNLTGTSSSNTSTIGQNNMNNNTEQRNTNNIHNKLDQLINVCKNNGVQTVYIPAAKDRYKTYFNK